MSDDFSGVQYELLLPWQLRDVIARRPIVYVPLGTYEWHCEHLPVGLDALTAHGLCLRAAALDGGVVLQPLQYGTGGGHGNYPWTVIMPTAAEIEPQLVFTLSRLQDFGFRHAAIFTGHFASTQLEMIDRIQIQWNAKNSSLKVLATSVNRIEGLELEPDHAGIFETTLLAAMWPHLVQLERLRTVKDAPLAAGDVWEQGRHDPKHPLWGVVGPDPRHLKSELAKPLLDAAVAWLVSQVRQRFTAT